MSSLSVPFRRINYQKIKSTKSVRSSFFGIVIVMWISIRKNVEEWGREREKTESRRRKLQNSFPTVKTFAPASHPSTGWEQNQKNKLFIFYLLLWYIHLKPTRRISKWLSIWCAVDALKNFSFFLSFVFSFSFPFGDWTSSAHYYEYNIAHTFGACNKLLLISAPVVRAQRTP